MNVLLSGSVAFDYLMTFPGYFKDHILPEHLDSISLSFLVDSMVRHNGGVAANIAYTMALLGGKPRLWATVGEDFEEYRAWLEDKGVDTSGAQVISDEFTASFFVNTDRSNAQIASFYPGAMAHAGNLSLFLLENDLPDLVVISPNDPGAMVRYVEECVELDLPYVYDPSQQIVRLSAEDLSKGILHSRALFVNEYEAALIKKTTSLDPKGILQHKLNDEKTFIVITRGEYGAIVYFQDATYEIPAVQPDIIVDPTGVGDAFRGGFLTGYAHGFSMDVCGRMGSLSATYCLEQRSPQGHSYSLKEFVERYENNFTTQDDLQKLLIDTG
jgi:adenosine kinase